MLEKKYFFCSVTILISIAMYSSIVNSFKGIYSFDIDKTSKTKGVLTKASLYDGIGTTKYECEYLYSVNGVKCILAEDLPYDTISNFKVGDSINVLYNINRVCVGTINKSSTRYWEFGLCGMVLVGFLYSILIFSIGIFSFVRNKFSA